MSSVLARRPIAAQPGATLLKKEMRGGRSTTAADIRVHRGQFSSSLPFGLSLKRDNNAVLMSRGHGRFSEVRNEGSTIKDDNSEHCDPKSSWRFS